MEDVVLKYLNEILNQKSDTCKCEQCKTDMASYALNRIKPMYVVSSRGIIHTENIKREQKQEEIDVYSTVAEAVEVISNTRRHEHDDDDYDDLQVESGDMTPNYYSRSGCFYNFPQIVGRIFDSSSINQIKDATITLFDGSGNTLSMFNKYWHNPFDVVSQTNGTYTFWPAPIPADRAGIQKDFQMYLAIDADGYITICKFFFIRLVSDNDLKKFIKKENIFYINDIFLNPEGAEKNE
jgi:competence protein ComFB